MLNKITLFMMIGLIMSHPMTAVFADDERKISLNNERLYQAVDQFIQQMIQHFLVKTCGEVMQNAINGQSAHLFPEIALRATNQATVELFKQEDMKNLLWGIFDENKSQAKNEIDLGMPQAYIETGIKKRVERDIQLVVDDPIFRYVIETMLNQAMVQQQQIVMMTVAQQQAQLLAIRQQQMMVQQQVMQQVIQQMIESQYK